MITVFASSPSLSLSAVDWTVIAAYSLAMVGMGLYLSRAATKSADGFLIGERSLPWWVIGFSNASTYSDSGGLWVWVFFVGGFMYLNQIAWIAWPIWMPLVGVFWAKMWRRSGLVTTGELLEFRYSGKAAARFRGVYGLYACACWATIFLGFGLAAVSQILAPLIGWQPLTIILVFGGIATAYTILGGLLSAAYVDVPQFFIFFFAAFVLLFFGVQEFGSYREMLDQAMANRDADFWQIFPPSSGTNTYVDPRSLLAIVLIGLFLAGSPSAGEGWTAQRCLAARDERHAVLGQMFSSVLSLVIRMAPLLPLGILAIALYPSADPGVNSTAILAGGDTTPSITAWSQLVVRYADQVPGFGGLMISAVLAGFMSTVGTQLQWGSSFVVNDFYRRHVRPEAPEREFILVSRLTMLAMMIVATVLAMSITDLLPWVVFINAAMIAPALPLSWLRWFWWRFNIWGELFGLMISLPLAVYIWFGLGASAWPFWQPTLLLLGIGLVGSVLVALATPAESEETLRRFYLQIRPPGAWGPIRNRAASAGQVNLAHLRHELKWDLNAAGSGIVFCFSITWAFFSAVMLDWISASVLAVVAVLSGYAFFNFWLRSVHDSLQSREDPEIAPHSVPATAPSNI